MKSLTRLLLGCTVFGCAQFAGAQGTAFTYQGRLNDGGNPATGVYDLTFSLFDIDSGSTAIATTVTNSAVGITNGLFTVALDFGANFPGANRWLEIGVRTNGAASFTTILPRQPITPTPSAITASNLSGTLPVAQLSGTLSSMQLGGSYSSQIAFNNPSNSFAGNGTGLTNVNAATLGGLTSAAFWKTTGNAGTSPTNGNFLGTTDTNALDLRVNNGRVLRLQPTTNTVNIIAGWSNNAVTTGVVSAAGATISGGGTPLTTILVAGVSTVFTNMSNNAFADFGTIGGGLGNQIGYGFSAAHNGLQSKAATIGGGLGNAIHGDAPTDDSPSIGSTIGGGIQNLIENTDGNTTYANTISGGYGNLVAISPSYATIGGGQGNIINYNSSYGTIGGGVNNLISDATGGTIAGGENNAMSYPDNGCTIGGGFYNGVLGEAVGSQLCTVAGGCSNVIKADFEFSTISGGFFNRIVYNGSSPYVTSCTIGGGDNNTIQGRADGASIGGGSFNQISNGYIYSVISGGYSNRVTGPYSMIPGGLNDIAGSNAFAAGSYAQATNQGAFVWADSNPGNFPFNSITNNEFAVRATGGARIVTAIDGFGNVTAGVKLNPGDTSWSTISDRNAKKDFASVDGEKVLDKLDNVPVEQWHYKWEADDSVPHMGPMAQDFKHAFYPGRDDKSITTLEFDGVEMAAIQGLNQKVEEQAETIQSKDVRINDLEQRLERLERIVSESKKQPRSGQ